MNNKRTYTYEELAKKTIFMFGSINGLPGLIMDSDNIYLQEDGVYITLKDNPLIENVSEKRNPFNDLKACGMATPGPWKVGKLHETNKKLRANIFGPPPPDMELETDPDWAELINRGELIASVERNNYPLIEMAREALPYWITRTQRLEKALDEIYTIAMNAVTDISDRKSMRELLTEIIGIANIN